MPTWHMEQCHWSPGLYSMFSLPCRLFVPYLWNQCYGIDVALSKWLLLSHWRSKEWKLDRLSHYLCMQPRILLPNRVNTDDFMLI